MKTADPTIEPAVLDRDETRQAVAHPPAAPCERPAAATAVHVIKPASRWQLINLRELWQSRELLYFLAWRDFKVRYKQTVLGVAWAVIQPAMMMIVFSIFFGRIAKLPSGDLPYPLFVFAGLLPWTFFSGSVNRTGNSMIQSVQIVTKVYFPRLAIPISSIGAGLIDFAIAFGLLIALMIYYGVAPGAGLLLVPGLLVLMTLAALGVGTLLAALNVAYRDFRYVIPFMVQIWMFATPGVYMSVRGLHLPEPLMKLLALNPMTGVIGSFRAATLNQPIPWADLGISSAVIVVLLLVGCFYFRSVEDGFADII